MKHYRVDDSRTGKVFETYEEAIAYANEIASRFNVFVQVEETNAAPTHVYMGVAGK